MSTETASVSAIVSDLTPGLLAVEKDAIFSRLKELFNSNSSRILIYGLPGTGKTTMINNSNEPIFDTDYALHSVISDGTGHTPDNAIRDSFKTMNWAYIISEVTWRIATCLGKFRVFVTNLPIEAIVWSQRFGFTLVAVKLPENVALDRLAKRSDLSRFLVNDRLPNSWIADSERVVAAADYVVSSYEEIGSYIGTKLRSYSCGVPLQNEDISPDDNRKSSAAVMRVGIFNFMKKEKISAIAVGSEGESITSHLLAIGADITHINTDIPQYDLFNPPVGDTEYTTWSYPDSFYDVALLIQALHKPGIVATGPLSIFDFGDEHSVYLGFVDTKETQSYTLPVNTRFFPNFVKDEMLLAVIDLRTVDPKRKLKIPTMVYSTQTLSLQLYSVSASLLENLRQILLDTVILKVPPNYKIPEDQFVIALFSLSNSNNYPPVVTLRKYAKHRFIINYPITGYSQFVKHRTLAQGPVLLQTSIGNKRYNDYSMSGGQYLPGIQCLSAETMLANIHRDTKGLLIKPLTTGCFLNEELRSWMYCTNMFLPVQRLYTQYSRFNVTVFVKVITDTFRSALGVSNVPFHSWRRQAVTLMGGNPIVHHRIHGYFPNGSKELHLAKGDFVSVAGHLFNLLVYSSYQPVDFYFWLGVVENNVSMLSGGSRKVFDTEAKNNGVVDELLPSNSLKQFHSYADFKLAVVAFSLFRKDYPHLDVPPSLLYDINIRLDEIMQKYPRFRKHGRHVDMHMEGLKQSIRT